jgi:hypothetical protein
MTDPWRASIDLAREAAHVRTLRVISLVAGDADTIGKIGLQTIAKEAGMPVIVEPGSVYHAGLIFWPGEPS